jgi:hypothetical protein
MSINLQDHFNGGGHRTAGGKSEIDGRNSHGNLVTN